MSCRVTFVDEESDKLLEVSDFRELGYEYMKYKGENFIRCRECGILVRGNKNGTKRYCSSCAKYTPQETKTIVCVDCGREVEIDSKNNQSCRCSECYTIYRRNKIKENVKNYREKHNL